MSIFGAETLGFSDAINSAIYTRSLAGEILYQDVDSKVIPIVGVTDSKQLQDSLLSTKQCGDQRLRVDLAMLQEASAKEGVRVVWCPTKKQLADALTKKSEDSSSLCEVLETGFIKECVF